MGRVFWVISTCAFAFALFNASFVNAATEPLKSPELKAQACKFLVETYPEDDGWYEPDMLRKFGIELTKSSCQKMDAVVTKKKEKKVGSKKYVVGLEMIFSNDDIFCKLEGNRSVSVSLDDDDRPIINLSDWRISEVGSQACYVKADPAIINLSFDAANNGLTKIDQAPVELYIPDYLELGEPDDGTVGTGHYTYELKKQGRVLGYVVEYWYANSEGEWASRYILHYNAKGILLGNFVEADGYDFCDYPFFEADMGYCQ